MELEDDILRCPHCKVRVRRPKPATQDRVHHRTCKKCGKKYVVYDEVEHWFQTAEPPPVQIGQKFKHSKDGGLYNPEYDPTYTIENIHLTRSQGWWVFGRRKKGHCSTSVDSIELVPQRKPKKKAKRRKAK